VSRLRRDHELVQNHALGAFLQWRFATGYSAATDDAAGVPAAQVFLVLPILFHEPTFEILASTNRPTGLRGFAAKFGSSKERASDLLLSIHDRVDRTRELSLTSLRMGMAFRLLTVDRPTGTVLSLTHSEPRAFVPEAIRPLSRNAEKLGEWCSRLTGFEISSILKVSF